MEGKERGEKGREEMEVGRSGRREIDREEGKEKERKERRKERDRER